LSQPVSEASAPIDDNLDDPFDVWFAPSIDPKRLRTLMRRDDLHGILFFLAWLILCAAGVTLVVMTRATAWLWATMLLYGILLCFAYAASHECAHGTAFRSRWLNEAVFWITSVVFIEEPLYRRYSHASHHTHTWFNGSDPQKPYGNPLTLTYYLFYTLGVSFYRDAASQLLRHARQRFTKEELAFLPPSERAKVARNSRIMMAIYLGLILGGVVLSSSLPFILYFLPRQLGSWVVTAYINTQHMCMAEDLHDHRQTTRSIHCNTLERLLYWNMNHHIEHHLFPSVPFHALPRLNAEIRTQLPSPSAGVVAANVEIWTAILKQRRDPGFNLSHGPMHRAIS